MPEKSQTSEEVLELFRRYGDLIRWIIQRRKRAWQDREDLFQEVFLKLLRWPIPTDRIVDVKPYLYRIVTNTIIEGVRADSSYWEALKRHAQEMYCSAHEYCPADADVVDKEDETALASYVGGHLPDCYTQVLLYRYRDGLKVYEIAAKTGLATTTVSGYLHKAKRDLRKTRRYSARAEQLRQSPRPDVKTEAA